MRWSVVEPVLELGEPLLEIPDATVAVLLPSPAEREPRDDTQHTHARDGADRSLRHLRRSRQPALELPELAVETVPRRLDLLHRFSCCFAHWTSSFSDSCVSSGLDALERNELRAASIATAASRPNTTAMISIAAHRGRTRSSASAPAIPRKPITNNPSTAAAPKTPMALARAP